MNCKHFPATALQRAGITIGIALALLALPAHGQDAAKALGGLFQNLLKAQLARSSRCTNRCAAKHRGSVRFRG